jgi:hypothetical protein
MSISMYAPLLTGASVPPISQVCVSSMLFLPSVGNYKRRRCDGHKWHEVYENFVRVDELFSEC